MKFLTDPYFWKWLVIVLATTFFLVIWRNAGMKDGKLKWKNISKDDLLGYGINVGVCVFIFVLTIQILMNLWFKFIR